MGRTARARGSSTDLSGGAAEAAAFLRTLANENRLMILCVLAEGELSVGDLAGRLGITHPNASQHLFRLKAEGLVDARRDGQTVYYSVASQDVLPIIAQLHRMFCAK
jgi:ArsR family transcriptional regulator, virulence genes transcriptional regulator